jgi:hypothetical protein
MDLKRPFERILEMTMKNPLLLYDPEERRAWHVPTLSAILSMAQAETHLYTLSGLKSIPSAKASWDGGKAAYDVIHETVAVIDSILRRQLTQDQKAAVKGALKFRGVNIKDLGHSGENNR